MLRFAAWDLGLAGGGASELSLEPVGVLGADSVGIGGARFERMRIGALGGSPPRSTAEAERIGGGVGVVDGLGPIIPMPGEALCVLEGGGGGAAGFGGSAPACASHRVSAVKYN